MNLLKTPKFDIVAEIIDDRQKILSIEMGLASYTNVRPFTSLVCKHFGFKIHQRLSDQWIEHPKRKPENPFLSRTRLSENSMECNRRRGEI